MSENRTSGSTPSPSEIVAYLNEIAAGTLLERMGMVITEASPERVVATMPVEGNTQPAGLLHGGASAALAETVASYASSLHAGPHKDIVGIELNITHHRGLRSGTVTATAEALKLGGRLAAYEIRITGPEGELLATSRLTCMILDKK